MDRSRRTQDAGGTFYHDVSLNGTRFATCCYKDAEGKYGCDSYINGVYIGTSAEKKGPPVSGPAAPPGNNPPVAPPITEGPVRRKRQLASGRPVIASPLNKDHGQGRGVWRQRHQHRHVDVNIHGTNTDDALGKLRELHEQGILMNQAQ